MSVQGRFVVNNAPMLTLEMFGVGTFPAFSGDKLYRNRGGCTAIADKGPIPSGRYRIVDRPAGGIGSQLYAWGKDMWNSANAHPTHHDQWFALYRDDGQIDDWTWVNGVQRGNFRLHPVGGSGVSFGCITLERNEDFQRLRQTLLHTPKVWTSVPELQAYGWIEVVTIGDTCP
ncbi:hypothetical protein BTHE68_32990 [Burkholderia sp. THE68]|uniref:DUF2778 domain-containing protein n=1 Tax=Burkholderia sp. THE68 TaxID=758782 RepID=UPI001318B759|nr:DUF2778 domain-containing protein [Burkholderia sp. THE68]BBU29565.1 hypothetical protein BTHE68_32990 [Burkholderia sp. THE68]